MRFGQSVKAWFRVKENAILVYKALQSVFEPVAEIGERKMHFYPRTFGRFFWSSTRFS